MDLEFYCGGGHSEKVRIYVQFFIMGRGHSDKFRNVEKISPPVSDNVDRQQNSEAGEEEEWAMGAAHDIARLCAEVTLRWRAFLHHTSDRPHVHHALAARHHALR